MASATGGGGGKGGTGAPGGVGGAGGTGAPGGGGFVLAARGMLHITASSTLNVSAGTPTSGAAGGAAGIVGGLKKLVATIEKVREALIKAGANGFDDDPGVLIEGMVKRGQNGADSRVVRNFQVTVQRHIEIKSEQNLFPFDVNFVDIFH